MTTLPSPHDCCWTASASHDDFPRLLGRSECGVMAGIVGLSAALTLCEARKSVGVPEPRKVGPDPCQPDAWRPCLQADPCRERRMWQPVAGRLERGSIEADQVILATLMSGEGLIDLASPSLPRCHVAMAFWPQGSARIDGMFIGVDEPTHPIRMGLNEEGPLLIVLGPRFKNGQNADVAQRFVDLDDWPRTNPLVSEAVLGWCNKEHDTADHMPHVGKPDTDQSSGAFFATGVIGWGISNGTASGLGIQRQTIIGRRSWKHLYDPNRPSPDDFSQSADSQPQVDELDAIARGEGGVIARGDKPTAVWRDDAGELHAVSAACTHMDCTVMWNNANPGLCLP